MGENSKGAKLWSGPQVGLGISEETLQETPQKSTEKSTAQRGNVEKKTEPIAIEIDDALTEVDTAKNPNASAKRAKVRNTYELTNDDLSEFALPSKLMEIRAELEPGDHIKISRGQYWHHALVTSKPVPQADGSLRCNVIEFSVPGWNRFTGVRRERTMILTNEIVASESLFRIDGHYAFVPEEKWNKIKRHLADKARNRIVCSCRLCVCDAADPCTCGRPARECQDKPDHYESYFAVSKNCEHFIFSFFGTPRSLQAEGICCLPYGRNSFESADSISSGTSSYGSDDRQETQRDHRSEDPSKMSSDSNEPRSNSELHAIKPTLEDQHGDKNPSKK